MAPGSGHEELAIKTVLLSAAAAASVTTGLFESLLMDPLVPCLLGALAGEVVRSLWPTEPPTDRMIRRIFISVAAVFFGTIFSFYTWRMVPLVTPGFAKLFCGIVGWVAIQAFGKLDVAAGVNAAWNAIVKLTLSIINSKEPKE